MRIPPFVETIFTAQSRRQASRISVFGLAILIFYAVIFSACSSPSTDEPAQMGLNDFLGRWNLKIQVDSTTYPSWLELTQQEENLEGRFVGKVGHARPVSNISIEGLNLTFTLPPQYERMDSDLRFTGQLSDGLLSGTTNANAPTGVELNWTAVRAPSLETSESVEWGSVIQLFNGQDITDWHLLDEEQNKYWQVENGVLVNNVTDEGDIGEGTGLISNRTFTDFKLHAEFKYPEGSNSGIYLRGRYEVQIQDDYGKEPSNRHIAGVYGFLTPTINAAKKAGEWQQMDITLLGRNITIVLNNEMVIDHQEIPGITGGALDANEGEPGPVFIQGDHGPVSFRSITITPAL